MKILENADAFVINGAGMEAFIDKALKQQPDLKIIESSKGIEIIKDDSGNENPHVWVSVSNVTTQVKNIARQLGELDAGNAESYMKNAAEYVKCLEALRDKMHMELEPFKNKEIVTFHEAFPYFAKEFQLEIAAVIEREPGSEPTPKELEDTIKIIRASGIKALFTEPQYPSKAAEVISRETGAKVCILDPVVTGEAKQDNYDDYLNIMEQNLKTLKEALK
jgi:zinc transport system substrate-binding protein